MAELTGTAGRQLLGRLGVRRDGKDRAAANDNRPVELARGEDSALGERLGCEGATNTYASRQRADVPRFAGHPMADLE